MGLRSNNPNSAFDDIFAGTGGVGNLPTPPETGINASGGTTETYTSGSDVYQSHTFTSPGDFVALESLTILGTIL